MSYKLSQIMTEAWTIARRHVRLRGGSVRSYLAQGLSYAWWRAKADAAIAAQVARQHALQAAELASRTIESLRDEAASRANASRQTDESRARLFAIENEIHRRRQVQLAA